MSLTNGYSDPNDIINHFYEYNPSAPAALIFLALFGMTTLTHIFYLFRLRATYFIPLIIGGIMETFGYYGRYWSHDNKTNISPFILQFFLLLLGPIFLAASIYMSLGRLITALDAAHLSSIRPKWLTKLFVLNDIICLIVQVAGAALQISTSASAQATGRKLVIGGLVFQLLVFVGYVLVAWRFHRRLNDKPTEVSGILEWRRHMWVQYFASGLILVRNIYRIAEYAEGSDGFIQKHEVMIYIFDAALMFMVIAAPIVVHPGRLLRSAKKWHKEQPEHERFGLEGVSSDEEMEIKDLPVSVRQAQLQRD